MHILEAIHLAVRHWHQLNDALLRVSGNTGALLKILPAAIIRLNLGHSFQQHVFRAFAAQQAANVGAIEIARQMGLPDYRGP
jgi:hypothetical protein